jgi:hypothetical protein
MTIDDLIETLTQVKKEYGNVNVQIMVDPLQKQVMDQPPYTKYDNINLIKMGIDNSVILSNEYISTLVYNDIAANIKYNTATGLYEGELITDNIGGFNATFSCVEIGQIEEQLKATVEEYLNFLDNAIISKSNEIVNNKKDEIIKTEEDLDYGEV